MMIVAVISAPALATEVSNEANVAIELRHLPACRCVRATWETTWHANDQATCIHHRYGMDKL